jgi:lysophospholipase L1-like esterase
MLWRKLPFIIAAASWLLPLPLWAGSQQFLLKGGDTVVFYGDSITAQDLYTQWIELYTVTRFPDMRVHFFEAGVGGDRVSGGYGGSVDLRLSRDVYSRHPSVITIMLGMNDGGYHLANKETEDAYLRGYEHILASIHEALPRARVVILGPSPFDDITRPPTFPGGYNSVMKRFVHLDRNLAREHGYSFLNLNSPVQSLLERAQALDPLFARLILPDRVHPAAIGHWAMAVAILKAWNAPSQVSSVTIDAHAVHVRQSLNASVEHLEADGATVRWNEKENALPLPFDANNAMQHLILQLTDIQKRLNQELLRVTGLNSGNFALAIDGKEVGVFSADELSTGINLADYQTPMRDQALSVSWLIADRDRANEVHLDMLIRKPHISCLGGKGDVLETFEGALENLIYNAAAPKPHSFTLSPATKGPNRELSRKQE